MTQVFEHGAFHGDAHPSNIIIVSPERYGLIDFGMIGQISDREMRVLTDYMIHLVRQQPIPQRLHLPVREPQQHPSHRSETSPFAGQSLPIQPDGTDDYFRGK